MKKRVLTVTAASLAEKFRSLVWMEKALRMILLQLIKSWWKKKAYVQ